MRRANRSDNGFSRTKQAANLFSNLINCAQPNCSKESGELLHLGTACKHAFCWGCVNQLQTVSQPMCSRCYSPLEVAKPTTATMFNNLAVSIEQFNNLLSDYESAVMRNGMNVQDNLQTQKLFDNNFESPPRRTIDEFIATQCPSSIKKPPSALQSPLTPIRERPLSSLSMLSISPEIDDFAHLDIKRTPKKPPLANESKPSYSTQNPALFMTQELANIENSQIVLNDSAYIPLPKITKSFEFTKVPKMSYGGVQSLNEDKWDAVSKNIPADDSFDEIVKSALKSKTPVKHKSTPLACSTPVSINHNFSSRTPFASRGAELTVINAVKKGDNAGLVKLLHSGHDVNEVHSVEGTPLCVAVVANRLDLCETLVENGAVINAHCGIDCNTALHYAVEAGNEEIVKYLLSKGASRSVKNLRARTAADMAATSSPIRKLVEKYRNYPRQPSIPPPLPEKFLVALDPEVSISDADKLVLKKMLTFVAVGHPRATHFVTNLDSQGVAKASNDLLMAMLRGSYIVTCDWLSSCVNKGQLITDSLRYEVQSLKLLDSGAFEGGVQNCRRSKDKMEPGLFRGCKFYLPHPKFSPYGSKQLLTELIRLAEGEVLTRPPTFSAEDPLPFHGRQHCRGSPYFIVCDVSYSVSERYLKKDYYNIVWCGWIFECLTKYEFVKHF